MKISIIMNYYPRDIGGGAKIIHEYANYFVSKGADVVIYYQYSLDIALKKWRIPKSVKNIIEKIRIEKVPFNWFKLDKRIRKVAIKEINDENIRSGDWVIATTCFTANPVWKLTDLKGKKAYLIQDFENWGVTDEFVYNTYKLGLNNIVVSNWLKKLVTQYDKNKPVVISNGINQKIFNVKNAVDDRIEHSIVFQYRKGSYKGGEYYPQIVKLLKKRFQDLTVNIIGIEDRPSCFPDYCNYYHNITPKLVAEINNKSQVFVCCSVNEGFGLPGLEAMACGCAFVSTAYKGVFEYAVDGENAILCDIGDVKSMVENISILFVDADKRKRISENGVRTAKQRTIETQGNKFWDYLTQRSRNEVTKQDEEKDENRSNFSV